MIGWREKKTENVSYVRQIKVEKVLEKFGLCGRNQCFSFATARNLMKVTLCKDFVYYINIRRVFLKVSNKSTTQINVIFERVSSHRSFCPLMKPTDLNSNYVRCFC